MGGLDSGTAAKGTELPVLDFSMLLGKNKKQRDAAKHEQIAEALKRLNVLNDGVYRSPEPPQLEPGYVPEGAPFSF